jgi:hypothetical protein
VARADRRAVRAHRAPLSGSTSTPAAIQRGGPSVHRRRLLAASIFRRSVRPLTTGLERAAGAATQRPAAAPCAVFERSRPRSARREHPSRLRPERDRSTANAGAASALCVQLREAVEARRNPCRQPAESSGAGGLVRRAWPQAGRLRAWERPPGSGGPVRAAVVGRRGSALKWHAGHGAPLLLPPSARRHARP